MVSHVFFLICFFHNCWGCGQAGERKEKKARVCRRSLSRCLAVSLPSAFRYQPGGAHKGSPPKRKEGGQEATLTFTLFSPSRCVPVNACHVDILCRNIWYIILVCRHRWHMSPLQDWGLAANFSPCAGPQQLPKIPRKRHLFPRLDGVRFGRPKPRGNLQGLAPMFYV